jgi:nucleosome binding factor SPN SPT16 subunit
MIYVLSTFFCLFFSNCLLQNSPDENASLAAVQSMFIAYGTAEDGMTYSRTQAMHVSQACPTATIAQLWLFGYELPDMILLFTKTKLLVLASKKKTDFMSPVVGEQADGLPTIETLIRDKNDKDAANFSIMIKTIKAAGVVSLHSLRPFAHFC